MDDPVETLHIGLEEIPAACLLADGIRWALDEAPNIEDYRDAHQAVTERYGRMNRVHTINNACLTVWGITIGGRDFTKVISETVAMSARQRLHRRHGREHHRRRHRHRERPRALVPAVQQQG